jgi:hypothetical protein
VNPPNPPVPAAAKVDAEPNTGVEVVAVAVVVVAVVACCLTGNEQVRDQGRQKVSASLSGTRTVVVDFSSVISPSVLKSSHVADIPESLD